MLNSVWIPKSNHCIHKPWASYILVRGLDEARVTSGLRHLAVLSHFRLRNEKLEPHKFYISVENLIKEYFPLPFNSIRECPKFLLEKREIG